MEPEVPFTSARHLSLFWATSVQSMPPHPTSWISILILSCQVRHGPSSGLIPSGFPTKTKFTPTLSLLHPTCRDYLSFVTYSEETIFRTQLVGEFIINLGTKFQTRISSALLVNFIKAAEMFFFYIQTKCSPEKCCIFLQPTLLCKMVAIIIHGWFKIVCVRHTDVDLEKKSLRMVSIVVMFIQMFLKIGYVIRIRVWWHTFAHPDSVVTSKLYSYLSGGGR